MIWKAWLTGHEFDLLDLSELFASGDIRIFKEGDQYCLASTEIDNRPAGEGFHEAASRLIELVNGVGQAKNSSFRPVSLSGTYKEGDHQHHVVIADTVEARSRVSAAAFVNRADGTVAPSPPPPGPELVKKALRHPDAAEVLRIMGRPDRLLGSTSTRSTRSSARA
jgi:hypothetical protein